MKVSIAVTLIITAAVFSFVSGYSIGNHSKADIASSMANQPTSNSVATANAAESAPEAGAPSGGYGSPAVVEQGDDSNAPAPGYGGSSSPGYGSSPSPGYGQ